MVILNQRHTEKYINSVINCTLMDYGISLGNDYRITTDNGSNIVKVQI